MSKFWMAVGALMAGIGTLLSPAYAAVPTEASTAVTGLVTDAGTFVGSFWGIVTAVVIAFAFIKLFKKGVGKAT